MENGEKGENNVEKESVGMVNNVSEICNLYALTDVILKEVQNKVNAAFDIFDHENNKSVDIKEVGTIIRSMGCCPSEAELHDLLAEMEKPEPTGMVTHEDFLPVMTRVLMEKRYKPRHEDEILRAFQALDVEDQGFLTEEKLRKYMTEEGEVFNQEEMEEMLAGAIDPETGKIDYRQFVPLLVIEDS